MRMLVITMIAFLMSTFVSSIYGLECPPFPQQANKDWEVEVNAAIAKIGPVKGGELRTRTNNATKDLLGKLPDAGRVYLEQMMYSAYCSALRDDKTIKESEKAKLLMEYNREVRKAITTSPASAPKPATKPPKNQSKGEIPPIPSLLKDNVEVFNHKDSLMNVIINDFKDRRGNPKIPYIFFHDFAYCLYLKEWGDNMYIIDIGIPDKGIRRYTDDTGSKLHQLVEEAVYLLLRNLGYKECYIDNDISARFSSFTPAAGQGNDKFTLLKLTDKNESN